MEIDKTTEDTSLLENQSPSPAHDESSPSPENWRRDAEGFIVPSDADFVFLKAKYAPGKAGVTVSFQHYADAEKQQEQRGGGEDAQIHSRKKEQASTSSPAGNGGNSNISSDSSRPTEIVEKKSWLWWLTRYIAPILRVLAALLFWFAFFVVFPLCDADKHEYALQYWQAQNASASITSFNWTEGSDDRVVCPKGQVYDQYNAANFTQCFLPLTQREEFCRIVLFRAFYVGPSQTPPEFSYRSFVFQTIFPCLFVLFAGGGWFSTTRLALSNLLLGTTATEFVARDRSHQDGFEFRSWDAGDSETPPRVVNRATFMLCGLTPKEAFKTMQNFPVHLRGTTADGSVDHPDTSEAFWSEAKELEVEGNVSIDEGSTCFSLKQRVAVCEDISLPVQNWPRSRIVQLHNRYSYRFGDEEVYHLFLSGFEEFYKRELLHPSVASFDIVSKGGDMAAEDCLVKRGPRPFISVRARGQLNRQPEELPLQYRCHTDELEHAYMDEDPETLLAERHKKLKWFSCQYFPYSMLLYVVMTLLTLGVFLEAYLGVTSEAYTMYYKKVFTLDKRLYSLTARAKSIQHRERDTEVRHQMDRGE